MKPLVSKAFSPSYGKIPYLRARRLMLAGLSVCALASCTTTRGSYCDIAKPQRFSDATIGAMTDAEVERALVELEKLRRLCGVRP